MYLAREFVLSLAKAEAHVHEETGIDMTNPSVTLAALVIQKCWRAQRGKAVKIAKELRSGLCKMIWPIRRIGARGQMINSMVERQALKKQILRHLEFEKSLGR